MFQIQKQYDEMFKKQCVELVVKEGRTISSIQRAFGPANITNILSYLKVHMISDQRLFRAN
ncbi:transposase [Bacillus toyonensis]